MKSVPDLKLTQPERRSYLIPGLLAAAFLALAATLAAHFFPATTVNIAHVQSAVLPTHTVFKTDSIVLGQTQSQDVLYITETLRINNQMRAPIFLDDFTLTLTNQQGQQEEVKAVQKTDLPSVEQSFPKLQPLMSQPLLRETSIDPGKQTQGTLLFALDVPQAMWDNRKDATIKVDIYHQHTIYQTIPKQPSLSR